MHIKIVRRSKVVVHEGAQHHKTDRLQTTNDRRVDVTRKTCKFRDTAVRESRPSTDCPKNGKLPEQLANAAAVLKSSRLSSVFARNS